MQNDQMTQFISRVSLLISFVIFFLLLFSDFLLGDVGDAEASIELCPSSQMGTTTVLR
jgi:hypothetical protein